VEREKVAKSLSSLGLSRIETDVYLYVSSNPETTAGQMTKNIKIARSKTYEALNKLTANGVGFQNQPGGCKQVLLFGLLSSQRNVCKTDGR